MRANKPKPIRPLVVKGHSIIRNPGTGPLLERLRLPRAVDAIGFHRNVPMVDSYEEILKAAKR